MATEALRMVLISLAMLWLSIGATAAVAAGATETVRETEEAEEPEEPEEPEEEGQAEEAEADGPAESGGGADAAGPEPAETMVITASRGEQERFAARRSIAVVERSELDRRQVRSVPAALAEVPGVFLQQTNRGAGAPFIRGLVGPQNLILIDGIRFNTASHRTGPNQYLALIGPFGLQRLEIVRGPSSVLYGNGAMGGVIQAITRRPPLLRDGWQFGGRAQGTFSSADRTTGGGFEAWASGGGLALQAGLEVHSFGELRAGGGAEQPVSDYLASYGRLKLIYAPQPGWSASASLLVAGLRAAGRADQVGRGDLRFYDNDDLLAAVVLRHRGGDLFKRMRLSLSFQRLAERVDRYSCAVGPDGTLRDRAACLALATETISRRRRYADAVDVLGADGNLGVELWQGRLRLDAGGEFYQDLVASTLEQATAENDFVFEDRPRGNFTDGSTYSSLGLYLHAAADLAELGRDNWLVAAAGLRYSHFGATAEQVPELGNVDYGHDGLVGSAGLQLLRPGRYNVYFTFVQGFRAPNLQETTVLGDTGDRFEIPNPDLRPELANTLELGTRLNLEPAWVEAAYFYSFLQDAIVQQSTRYEGNATVDGKPVTRLVNGDHGAIQGAELGLGLRWWRLEARAHATWTEGQVTTERGTFPARRIPPLFGRVGLRSHQPDQPWFVELFVRWALRQDRLHPSDAADVRICETAPYSGLLRDPCKGTPGWWTLNLRAGLRLDERFRVDVQLANMTDARYRLHGSGFDAPGFDLRFSLTAEL